ncbi:unnamed protein product, partial [Oppiella nova]
MTYSLVIYLVLLFRRFGYPHPSSVPLQWLTNILVVTINLYQFFITYDKNIPILEAVFNCLELFLTIIAFIISCLTTRYSEFVALILVLQFRRLGHRHSTSIPVLWLTNLFIVSVRSGYETKCPMNDFNIFSKIFVSKNAYNSFESANKKYNPNKLKPEIRLLPLISSTVWSTYTIATVLALCKIAADFIQPYILAKLIDFVSGTDHMWHGVYYAIAFCVCTLMARLFECHSNLFSMLASYRVRSSLTTAIYKKMLRLSAGSRRNYTTGEINNIMSVDVGELCDFHRAATCSYTIPLCFIIGEYILWSQLGPSSLMVFVVMAAVFPLTSFIYKRIEKIQTKQMELKDMRMKQISEVLNNIKLLKLFGWEKPFMDRISITRHQEFWMAVPFIMTAVTFTVYIYASGLALTAKTAFVSVSVINIFRIPIARLPYTLSFFTRAIVSFRRIRKYLSCEELEESVERDERRDDSSDERYAVCLKKSCFSWGLEEEPILKDITLNVKKGSLVAIVGRVGSG